MESGVEDRSRLRHHVRAAREWLGRAEDSLDRAEDVRGDLNLMLARAELARAQETERPRPSVLWMRRIAPLCTAALLAGGILWTWDFAAPPAPPPVEKRTEEAAAEAGTLQRIGESPPLPAIPQPDSVPPQEEAAAETVFPVSEYREEPEETAVSPPEPETAAEPSGTRIPPEDMQRLMSSAGQSLRAVDIDRR